MIKIGNEMYNGDISLDSKKQLNALENTAYALTGYANSGKTTILMDFAISILRNNENVDIVFFNNTDTALHPLFLHSATNKEVSKNECSKGIKTGTNKKVNDAEMEIELLKKKNSIVFYPQTHAMSKIRKAIRGNDTKNKQIFLIDTDNLHIKDYLEISNDSKSLVIGTVEKRKLNESDYKNHSIEVKLKKLDIK